MSKEHLVEMLWKHYLLFNAKVEETYAHLHRLSKDLVHDHIALRTVSDSRVSLSALAERFCDHGWQPETTYTFEKQWISAQYFSPPDPTYPKIFISQLELDQCPYWIKSVCLSCIEQIPSAVLTDIALPYSGNHWHPLNYDTYSRLLAVSSYVAWWYVYGMIPHHFAVDINTFSQIKDLAAMHDTLSEWGVALNTQGGEIKGSPALYLEQSTTVAAQMPVEFSDHETLSVPSGYYEFMRRYQQKDGNIYQGFCADLEVALLDSP